MKPRLLVARFALSFLLSVTSVLTIAAQSPDTQFNGLALYRQTYKVVLENDVNLIDPARRAAWAKEWEHKFDASPLLQSEEGTDKACSALLRSTGHRFNTYLDREGTRYFRQEQGSKYIGIGIQLSLRGARKIAAALNKDAKVTAEKRRKAYAASENHPIVITSVERDSPAENAGLRAGDILRAVGDAPVAGLTIEEAIPKIVGLEGTKVRLTVERKEAGKTLLITTNVTRSPVVSHPVTGAVYGEGMIGYVRLKNFMSDLCMEELFASLTMVGMLQSRGLVLDLRGNTGGSVGYALGLVSMLLDEGTALEMIRREGDNMVTTRWVLDRAGISYSVTTSSDENEKASLNFGERVTQLLPVDLPLVILVNENSYSAAELVASALQYRRGAKIVGMPTGGKGVGQTVFNLPFGRTALVTTFEYRPGGVAIDWQGSVPNLIVQPEDDDLIMGDASQDKQLRAALQLARQLADERERLQKQGAAQRKKHEDEWRKAEKQPQREEQ